MMLNFDIISFTNCLCNFAMSYALLMNYGLYVDEIIDDRYVVLLGKPFKRTDIMFIIIYFYLLLLQLACVFESLSQRLKKSRLLNHRMPQIIAYMCNGLIQIGILVILLNCETKVTIWYYTTFGVVIGIIAHFAMAFTLCIMKYTTLSYSDIEPKVTIV